MSDHPVPHHPHGNTDIGHGSEVPNPPPPGEAKNAASALGVEFGENDAVRWVLIRPPAQREMCLVAGSNKALRKLKLEVLAAAGFDTSPAGMESVVDVTTPGFAIIFRQPKEPARLEGPTHPKHESPSGLASGASPAPSDGTLGSGVSSGVTEVTVTTAAQFSALKRDLQYLADSIASAKRPGYTQANRDVLHNFKATAARCGVTPMQAWAVHFEKHVSAVMSFAKDPNIPQAEGLPGRFADIKNYLDLGYALFMEAQMTSKEGE